MSDQPNNDAQNDTGLSKIELVGGKFAGVLLAVLFLAILLIDTALLSSWMEMRSPPLYFADPCTDNAVGASGGFSLVLVVVLALALLGLQLFSRRSFLFSAILAIAFLGFQIFVTFQYVDLVDFLSEAMGWYHSLPSLACSDELLRGQTYARYKAVEDLTTLQGGVQQTFTNMLQFNVVVGAFIAVLIWTVGGLTWVLRRGISLLRRSASAPQSGVINSAWLGVPERTILFQTAVLTLIAAMAGPMVMLFVNNPDAADATIRDVIWLPALLFLLDLARWALNTASDAAPHLDQTSQDAKTSELLLPPVIEMLRGKFDREIKAIVEIPADQSRQRNLQVDLPSLHRGKGLIIEETLGARHFDLIAKIINEEILDHGHTVLIICPEEHLARTETILCDLLGSGKEPGTRPRIWRLGQDSKRPDGSVDVLLTSQFSLEALASNVNNYEHELNLLGGTVALNLHETDFGLLKVALDRLKPSIHKADRLVGIFHSEPRMGIRAQVENFAIMPNNTTFTIMPNNTTNAATTTRFEHGIHQWMMVLDCNAISLLNSKENLPVGYRALISILSQERHTDPFVYGTSATYAALNWQNVSGQLLINETEQLLYDLNKIPNKSILPEQVVHSVALVDDIGNLADAVAVTVSTPHALEGLKLVTLGSYPMARFFAAELNSVLRNAPNSKAKREALKSYKDRFGSIVGKQREGPRELATKVRMTFRAEANAAAAKRGADQHGGMLKLSQDHLAEFMAGPGRAIKQLRINTSRGGLQRLFRSAYRLKPGETVVSVRAADADQAKAGSGRLRIKNYVLSGPPAEYEEAVPVLSIHGFADHHLPLADHGLSFAEGTRLWIGDKFLAVDQVDIRNRVVHCTTQNAEPLHPYHFVRDYALQLTNSGRTSFAVEGFFEECSSRQPFELITGYVDCAARTYKAYKFGTMRFPFGKGNIRPTTIQTLAVSHAEMRSCTLLRFLGEGQSTTAQRGRRSRWPSKSAPVDANIRPMTAEIAFTLSMTLQDVLASQFPSHAHHLAVLCPEASSTISSETTSPLDSFVIDRLRHMVSIRDNGLPTERARPAPVSTDLAKAYEKFSMDFSELGRRAQGDVAPARAASLSILLIEDSDHDLGIAQSFFDQRDRIFYLWRDFLRNCSVRASSPAETGYDFGSGQLSSVFDFDGALTIVEALCDTKR